MSSRDQGENVGNVSPWNALRVAYPKGKNSERINRAIRAECHGGNTALDRLNDAHKIVTRAGWTLERGAETAEATLYRFLLEVVDAMDDGIREDYRLPPRRSTDDLRRGGKRRG